MPKFSKPVDPSALPFVRSRSSLLWLVAATLTAVPLARAQCPGNWVASPMSQPGLDRRIMVLQWWDPDGSGPIPGSVVAGGDMTASGGTTLGYITRWDGSAWVNLGAGVDGSVRSLTTLPAGDVVAGGYFTNADGQPASQIARWNATAWSPFGSGMNSAVNTLATRANGELWAGGYFSIAGGTITGPLARWTGSSWATVGFGGPNGWVWSIARMLNGDMMVAGYFSAINGVSYSKIARWNGTAWSAVGGGVTVGSEIYELFVMPNGDLIASGNFTVIGGVSARNVARWNGSSWSPMGAGFPSPARDFAILPSGELVAANVVSEDFLRQYIAKWNGTSWVNLGSANGTIFALLTLPNGDLLVGGQFSAVDGMPANNAAVWRSGAAPSITTHPAPAAACNTGAATFTVAASGSPTPSFQWQLETSPNTWINANNGGLPYNGGTILASGATTAQLQLALNVLPGAPSIRFHCVATSACGNATTNPATLSFTGPCCIADVDDGSGTGTPDGGVTIDDMLYFLSIFEQGLPGADVDDGSGTGTPDGGVTIDDLLYYLFRFELGC